MPARTRAAENTPEPSASGDDGMSAHVFSDANEGYDDDGYPAGLLMWGQAGVYNAVDDRMATTALGDAVSGIVKRAYVTAGPGLTVSLAAGWLGVATCDDGTVAVVGSRQSYTLGPAQGILAGPATGAARADLLWCDVYPDQGRWRLSVIRESESAGRPGLPLARITCPAGANLAAAFTYTNMVPTFGSHADSLMLGTSAAGATRITPAYPIAPWMIRPRSHFRLKAYGWGRWGATVRHVMFRVGQEATPFVWLNFAGLGWPAGAQFSWNAEANIQCRMNRQNIMISLWATCGLRQGSSFDPIGPNAVSNLRQVNLTSWNPDAWNSLHLDGRFDQQIANQWLECTSATFETIEPWDIY